MCHLHQVKMIVYIQILWHITQLQLSCITYYFLGPVFAEYHVDNDFAATSSKTESTNASRFGVSPF